MPRTPLSSTYSPVSWVYPRATAQDQMRSSSAAPLRSSASPLKPDQLRPVRAMALPSLSTTYASA